MTLRQLIKAFRVLSNDKVEPYFWTDEEVTGWLNDAQAEACLRGRLLHAVETLPVTAGRADYMPKLYEIISGQMEHDGKTECLYIATHDTAGLPGGQGESKYITQDDNHITLLPAPVRDGTLLLHGYRLPADMRQPDDEPEIHRAHHRHLVQWALHQAFGIPDTEAFDPNRSTEAEYRFSRYFGLQTDSHLRRQTREDLPQTVKPFWV